jgi:hypothetical protein
VTDQPMDYGDYLIRQQQERMAQRFEALFTKDEDRARSGIQGIENLACHEAQGATAALPRRRRPDLWSAEAARRRRFQSPLAR